MLQKKFREARDWGELLELWDKNELWEIAIGLLHMSPTVPYEQDHGVCDGTEYMIGLYKKIRFYLEIAKMDQYPGDFHHRSVGQKAREILVHHLLKDLIKMMEELKRPISPVSEIEIPTWREIIGFFANKENSILEKEPYKSEEKMFAIRLHLSLKNDAYGPFFFPSETRISLSEEKDMAKALVNVRAFEHILTEKIFEAIPVLKEKIARSCWEYNPGEVKMIKIFPEGKEKWLIELENLKSKALQFALGLMSPREIVTTLMSLIVLRGEV